MKIFIFGAGASLGSQNPQLPITSSSRAPLIDELFSSRYKDIALHLLTTSELTNFREEVERRSDKSVEKWLGDQWNAIPKIASTPNKNSQIRLFGRKALYLWNVLRIVSNSYDENNIYRLFLESLSKEGIDFGIVDFNYDTLLDKAYQQVFHMTFLSLETYLQENFIKPHGSINWILEKRNNDPHIPPIHDTDLRIKMSMDQFFMNGNIPIDNLTVIDPMLEALRDPDIARVWERLGQEYFYPLVFIPLAQKNLGHIDNFYELVIGKANEMFQKAEEIYLIGYRANDEIINDLFKKAPDGTLLHVVSGSSADSISETVLKRATNLRKASIVNGGFAAFNALVHKSL